MLPGTRSAIVWTVPKKRAPAMLALNERAFVAEMQKRIGGFLGEISLAAPRSSFPLGFHHSARSEEHTSELQSLMRISYAVFCLKKQNTHTLEQKNNTTRHV